MKKLSTILKPTVLKEDAENACEDAMSCLNEIITMSQNLMEGLQDVSEDLDENMMNCISETRDKIKDACECALEAYGFDACCETCDDDEEFDDSDKELENVDEAVDWFKFIYSEPKIQIAKRVKATPTETLIFLTKDGSKNSKGAQLFQYKLIKKELEYRKANGNINKDGDPRYTKKYNGYDKTQALKSDLDEKDMGISKDDETKFHKKLDDLVHSTFGKRMDEAKTVTEPEEAGLNDYVMPKSVIKMIAKQQFSQVKTKSKLFDTVATLDKTKDLLHLFTSKKHKNILVGMFKIGKKASFFIHDTESTKANKLDNVGRYKDTKGFSDALSTLFEKKKEDSVKKK
jgi:hypothetical protein